MIRFVMVVRSLAVPALVTIAKNVNKKSMNAFVMMTNAPKQARKSLLRIINAL